MTALAIAIALKATLWAALMSVAALTVPAHHPQVRRRFALLGLWGLWVLPWLPLPWPELPATAITVANDSASQSALWLRVLTAVWALGSLIFLLRMAGHVMSILHLVRQSTRSTLHPEGAAVEVRFTSEIESPCMTGWLRPCVLLPLAAASWPESTLRATLHHECQHARQRDGLHRFCAALIRAIFWWNPAMHGLCGIYEAESEVCCDEEAATACSRREYGEMLLAHATQIPQPAFALSFARRSGLRVRIQRLFETRRHSRWLLSIRWLAACLLFLSAAVLAASIRVMSPRMAQQGVLKAEAQLRLRANPFPGHP